MLPIYRATDCPQDSIRGATIGVLGYGNQGRAQACNLRDSGYEVVVGSGPERPSAARASAEGFRVVRPESLDESVEILAVLAPDELHRELIAQIAAPETSAGRIRLLVFAHGFALQFDPPPFREQWDVVVVAPAGPGVQLRGRYTEGAGIPALMAVHADRTGEAKAGALAYAAAIGCARAGVLETTVREEVEIDLFGEQAVLCGGMNALTGAAFDLLVKSGYPEEMAYLECVQQLRLTAELVERFGIEGMRARISSTARFGDLSRGSRVVPPETRRALEQILREVRDGSFAREWLEARRGATGRPEDRTDRSTDSRIERAGRIIRGLFDTREDAKGVDRDPDVP